jgi:hypothetical protein
LWHTETSGTFDYETSTHSGTSGGRLSEGNNFDQKYNCPFGRVKLFLPARGKNLMTDTDDIIANKK